jgi:hypothetical protein
MILVRRLTLVDAKGVALLDLSAQVTAGGETATITSEDAVEVLTSQEEGLRTRLTKSMLTTSLATAPKTTLKNYFQSVDRSLKFC